MLGCRPVVTLWLYFAFKHQHDVHSVSIVLFSLMSGNALVRWVKRNGHAGGIEEDGTRVYSVSEAAYEEHLTRTRHNARSVSTSEQHLTARQTLTRTNGTVLVRSRAFSGPVPKPSTLLVLPPPATPTGTGTRTSGGGRSRTPKGSPQRGRTPAAGRSSSAHQSIPILPVHPSTQAAAMEVLTTISAITNKNKIGFSAITLFAFVLLCCSYLPPVMAFENICQWLSLTFFGATKYERGLR